MENMGVYTKERKGVTAEVLMAAPCTKSLGGESGGHKHEGCGGRKLCWKFAAVSWSGAGGDVYHYLLQTGKLQGRKAKKKIVQTVPSLRTSDHAS